MEVIILILPFALIIAAAFVISFVVAVKKGQFDDLDTPAYRILLDEKIEKTSEKNCIKE